MNEVMDQERRVKEPPVWVPVKPHLELFWPTIFFWSALLWQELWVKVFCVHSLTAEGMAVTALLLLPLALVLGVLCAAVPRRVGVVLMPVVMGIITLWVGAQIAYYSLFRTYLSLYSTSQVGMVFQNFGKDAFFAVLSSWVPILLILVPFVPGG